jgi:hypothetical protein
MFRRVGYFIQCGPDVLPAMSLLGRSVLPRMPRFVILRHEFPSGHARALHWDLMFEHGGSLRTWALSGEPLSAMEIEAELLPDHRLAYLDYEGPVSGDRGSVSRWDWGEYQLESATADAWQLVLHGTRLRGSMTVQKGVGSHFWRVSLGAAPTTG